MSYHINTDTISIEDLKRRIETTDLVPSRASLLKDLGERMDKLKEQGLSNLTDIRNALKTPKKLESLVKLTGIEKCYIVLLRREINSYFPKPFPLKSFDWLPLKEIEKLEKAGIKNSALFYDNFKESKKLENFIAPFKIKDDVLHQLSCLCNLVRMQWTSPVAARMFFDTGYDSVQKIVSADPDSLCDALIKINKGDRYFKGKIGLRDIKRLIYSAGYL